MQHTLIAVFDNRADAERAQDDLLLAGFKRDVVRLSNSDPTGITDSVTGSAPSPTERRHEGIAASIKHFFTDIFGTDNSEHAQRYSDAVSRGHHVLTVTTEDEPEVERAADIVERHGPVDIDEKHAEWASGAPVAHPESMRMSGVGGLQQSAPASRQSASLSQQSEDLQRHHGEPPLFAQQSLDEGAPMGQTYQESWEDRGASLQGSSLEGSALQGGTGSLQRDTSTAGSLQGGSSQRGASLTGSQQRDTGLAGGQQRSGVRVYSRMDETPAEQSISLRGDLGSSAQPDDEVHYRHHWNKHYGSAGGSYDEYAPAYDYGSEMANSAKYRGRKWHEIEPELQSTWESRHPDHWTWERFKAAAREGWDRITFNTSSRSDWDTHYSSLGDGYEVYEPAYKYGAEMARSDRYRGRKWHEVESDLKSDWETRHPGEKGVSTWERFKAAVRHGWDNITS